jgi:hypothetical protein
VTRYEENETNMVKRKLQKRLGLFKTDFDQQTDKKWGGKQKME